MKIAFISPTKHLEEFACYKGNGYHLLLAQHIISIKEYRDFYKEKGKKGEFLLLDNGAYEFGKSVDKSVLLEATLAIEPDMVVLPDKREYGDETIEMSFDFLNHLKSELPLKTRIMAVAQGRTPEEWLNCFETFAKHPDISTIGISNTNGFFPVKDHYFSRVDTINYLYENNLIPKGKTLHLCGLGNSGHMEIDMLKHYEFIEGIDTSAPIMQGILGIKINKDMKYEKDMTLMDFDSEVTADKKALIFENLDLFYRTVYE